MSKNKFRRAKRIAKAHTNTRVRIWDQVDSWDSPRTHNLLKGMVFNSLSTVILQQTESDMQKNSQVHSSVALGNIQKLHFCEDLISIRAEMSCGQIHL